MKQALRHFFEAIRAYPKRFFIALFFILCVTLLNAVYPWLLKGYLSLVTECNSYAVLAAGLLFFTLFLLARSGLNTLWYTSLDHFAGSYVENLVLRLEGRMARTDYAEIEKLPGGTIRNILFTDVLNAFRIVGFLLPGLFSALAVVLIVVGMTFFYNVSIALLIAAAVAAGLLLSWCSRRMLSKTSGTTNKALKTYDAWCSQFVDVLPLVMTNDILPYYQTRTSQNVRAFIHAAVREDRAIYWWQGVTSSYHALFSIAVSALLAIPLAGNSLVNLVFLTTLADLAMQNAQKVETAFQSMMKCLPSLNHIETLDILPDAHGREALDDISSIDFKQVSMTYPGGVQALKNVTCRLKKGDFIMLRGHNGSGKSTFVKLLTGLYRPTAGQLEINGLDSRCYSQKARSSQILYVNQDEQCLNETFKAYLEIMSGKALSVADCQHLLNMVDLPDDGRSIEGNGASLSVGQRKKLCLLKLMGRIDQASVIVLDELLAGMDTSSAHTVVTLLNQLTRAQNKIIIMIEHNQPDTLPPHKTFYFENGCLTRQEAL